MRGLRGDVDEPAIRADRHPFGLRSDRDRCQDLSRLRVDDGGGIGVLVGDVQPRAVRAHRERFGVRARREASLHGSRGGVHHRDHILVAEGHVDRPPVGTQADAAGPFADGDARHDLVRPGIDDRHAVRVLVGDVYQRLGAGTLRRRSQHRQRQQRYSYPASRHRLASFTARTGTGYPSSPCRARRGFSRPRPPPPRAARRPLHACAARPRRAAAGAGDPTGET